MNNILYVKNILYLLLIILSFHLLTGCLFSWSPSDEEAVELLKNYYSYYEEKGVEARVINRGKFIEECNCYPIEFQIIQSKKLVFNKTFYFYKNGDGTAGIKKFKFGVKHS
jgi:hypothetical protein